MGDDLEGDVHAAQGPREPNTPECIASSHDLTNFRTQPETRTRIVSQRVAWKPVT